VDDDRGPAALAALGWRPALEAAFAEHAEAGLDPARVVAADRGSLLVGTAAGERRAVVAGRLRHDAGAGQLPVVGDWVALRSGDDPAVVVAVLARQSWFARLRAGSTGDEQVLVANLDAIFIVFGLDTELNPRRIERWLTMAWEGGAQPVIVLNKADARPDPAVAAAEVEAAAPGVPVVVTSAASGLGLDELDAWLGPGQTVALLGASGVGKSSLANRLLGDGRQTIAPIRADGRGRHTTTRRELLRLPGGALLIDTPGLRTVLLGDAGEGLDDAFADIEALAAGCRFADCRHDQEPGCAVKQAVADGRLDPERLAAWRQLGREAAWLAARDDPRARAARERSWRAANKAMRDRQPDR
jgi:ribosome biogenesis GTPase / thiamine phosphate phosphatase